MFTVGHTYPSIYVYAICVLLFSTTNQSRAKVLYTYNTCSTPSNDWYD